MQKSTLKNLSHTLGISISTVSRALKDHPDISAATKKKVRELAEMMEYEPNSHAVQLRTQKSNVLGILVPMIDNFFYDSFIAAVEAEASRFGYSVLIMQSRDDVKVETSILDIFRRNGVMGLFVAISIGTENMSPYTKLISLGIPVIFYDRVPEETGFLTVCMADEAAARIAAETIIEKNKKKVLALFGHPNLSISKIRQRSFMETFKSLSPHTPIATEFPESSAMSTGVALAALTSDKPPDVIFCMGDLILIGVMKAIHKLNLKIPSEVAIVSISNGLIPSMYNPVITYVETSGSKLGKLAFAQMLGSLQNEEIPQSVSVESMLVKGGSI
ncbi:MAG: LacI family DNA-binding transcriptional regulator [Gloeobacteraceae cyanobacterium ES-bin-316]|nr:LacI family DNA-binding transcriptional regulator [Ferruginibacter sp.]